MNHGNLRQLLATEYGIELSSTISLVNFFRKNPQQADQPIESWIQDFKIYLNGRNTNAIALVQDQLTAIAHEVDVDTIPFVDRDKIESILTGSFSSSALKPRVQQQLNAVMDLDDAAKMAVVEILNSPEYLAQKRVEQDQFLLWLVQNDPLYKK